MSFLRSIRPSLVGVLLSFFVAAPAPVYAESETEPDDAVLSPASKSELRDQGVLYFRRGKYKQALEVLRQAYAQPEGRVDPIISFYLAQTHLKQDNVKDAFKYGENALDFAYSAPRHTDRIKSFMDELSSQYGPIEITSSAERGVIILAAQSAFLNPKKRAVYDSVRLQLASAPAQLPMVVYLPFGQYAANGTLFTVSGQSVKMNTVEVTVRESDVAGAATGGNQAKWWYIGTGAVLAAAGLTTYLLLAEDAGQSGAINTYELDIINGDAP